jgi:hypothetical protein
MRRGSRKPGVGALAQLGDAKFDRTGAGLPDPVAVTVALGQTFGVLLAIGRPGVAFDFQFHQTLGGKADHLAQQIGVWGLLHERAQVHHIVGHRWLSSDQLETICASCGISASLIRSFTAR